MVLSMLFPLTANKTGTLPRPTWPGLAALGLLLLLPVQAAVADSWHGYNRHYDDWRYGGGWRYDADRYDRWTGHAWRNPYRYGGGNFSVSWGRSWSHNRYRNPYRSHYHDRRHWRSYNRHTHWHSHDSDVAAGLVGGLVLGSLLNSALQPRSSHVYSAAPERRVVRSSRVSSRPVLRSSSRASGSRLLRDLQGRCFEINYDGAGNQQRIQVEDSRCHF
jgi:hypothetical protein